MTLTAGLHHSELLKKYRRQILQGLMDAINALIESLEHRRGPPVCSARGPAADITERRRCEAMAYGLLATRLMDEGMWPPHDARTTLASVEWVRNRLRPALEEPVAWWLPHAHENCRPFALTNRT